MTYSTNFGNPLIEATNYNSLQNILENLPDNTGQLISPRDVRDAVFTTWEKGIFKTIELGAETYIGTDNGGTISNYRYKMFLGKKQLQSGNDVLNNTTLLNSDTDIFIYNNKSDSNLSQQDTKVSFLAGDDFSIFTDAPYIESTKITGTPNRIDLNLTNPSSGGIIEINSDIIELGDNNGWIVDDTNGSLYPQNDGQNIGLTGTGNRIGTIYMASTVDYLNDLEFISGSSSITFDTDGLITTDSLHVKEDLKFKISASAGYFLSTDGNGNATWEPGKINTTGITGGYMNISDGIDDVEWIKPYADAAGITAGYILQSAGNPPNYGASGAGARPEWRSLSNLDTSGVTAGYILGSDGSNSQWVPISSGAGGSNSNIQFNNSGFLDGDSDFIWDNINNRLNINDINIGTHSSFNGVFSDNLTGFQEIIGGYDTGSNKFRYGSKPSQSDGLTIDPNNNYNIGINNLNPQHELDIFGISKSINRVDYVQEEDGSELTINGNNNKYYYWTQSFLDPILISMNSLIEGMSVKIYVKNNGGDTIPISWDNSIIISDDTGIITQKTISNNGLVFFEIFNPGAGGNYLGFCTGG